MRLTGFCCTSLLKELKNKKLIRILTFNWYEYKAERSNTAYCRELQHEQTNVLICMETPPLLVPERVYGIKYQNQKGGPM